MSFDEQLKGLREPEEKGLIENQLDITKALEVEIKSLQKKNVELKKRLDFETKEKNKSIKALRSEEDINKDSTSLINDFEKKLKEKNKEYGKIVGDNAQFRRQIEQMRIDEEEHLRVISVCQNLCKDLEKHNENLKNQVNKFPFKFLSDFEDWIIFHKKNPTYSWFFTKGKLRKKELKTLWVLLTDFWERFNI